MIGKRLEPWPFEPLHRVELWFETRAVATLEKPDTWVGVGKFNVRKLSQPPLLPPLPLPQLEVCHQIR